MLYPHVLRLFLNGVFPDMMHVFKKRLRTDEALPETFMNRFYFNETRV